MGYAQNSIPGGLGLARGDRQLFPENPVQERRFAHIRRSDDGYKAGFEFGFYSGHWQSLFRLV